MKLQIANIFRGSYEIYVGSRVPKLSGEAPEMLLGTDFFRSHRVLIANAQKKVYVSYIGGPVFRTPAATSTTTAAKP